VTPAIAAARGVAVGQDCASPSRHTAFHDADSLLDFVEDLAGATGLPIGIKSAVGDMAFWEELARLIATTGRGVDHVQVDGGEGGTGAAPLVFADHVAMPFKVGFARVFRTFAERGVHERVVFVGSGKLGFPQSALCAFALGADMVAVAREPMLAIGCIQAQRCHTGHCPTGVATHNRWLARGLDPELKGERLARYIVALRQELTRLSRACGVAHPALVTSDHLEILDGAFGARKLTEVFGYGASISLPGAEDRAFLQSLGALDDSAI
jgi:glutamate synthase domain-containing protein 2